MVWLLNGILYILCINARSQFTLTWIQAMKHSLKLTFSHRTRGPNCFFLSVASLVISSLPAWSSSALYTKSLTKNLCSRAWKMIYGSWLHIVSYKSTKSTLCLNSSQTLWNNVTVIKALSASWKIICVDLGTTISVKDSYLACQSLMLLSGTTTSNVVKYSESKTKCSFFTNSPGDDKKVLYLVLQTMQHNFSNGK